MGKLVVSLDGVVIKEVQITKDKTTLGRRPYNDIVIDNLAVSGEHAVLQMVGSDVFIEDLNSTNGTYINGKASRSSCCTHNDTVEIGKYKIKYLVDDSARVREDDDHAPGRPAAGRRRPPDAVGPPGHAGRLGLRIARCFGATDAVGFDQGAQRRGGRARGHLDQGGHHGRQAGRAGGFDHPPPQRLRVRACRGRPPGRASTACRWWAIRRRCAMAT